MTGHEQRLVEEMQARRARAIEQAESEATKLEALGGPRRLARAAEHREHARLWKLSYDEVEGQS